MGLIAPAFMTSSRPTFSPPPRFARGKPAPDLFLFAAEAMRAAPARCLVIEDSVPGVTGAARRRHDACWAFTAAAIAGPDMPRSYAPPARS